MSDDPEQPQGPRRPALSRETLADLGALAAGVAHTTGGGLLAHTTGGGLVAHTTGGGLVAHTTGGGLVAHTTGAGHTTTTVLDKDGNPTPGRYRIETRAVTEFEVLENGQVIIRRSETDGGEPEKLG